jgi:plasmid stabilization system protein ParE
VRVVVTPDAKEDADEAATWYRHRDPGTVSGFRRRFHQVASQLERYPESGTQIGSTQVRQITLAPYPYRAIYVIDAGVLYIAGIVHDSQSTHGWLQRRNL